MRDLWRPGGGRSRLTYRLLGVLIDGLPGESLFKTAVRDRLDDDELAEMAKNPPKGHGPWSRLELQVAALRDTVNMLAWHYVRTHYQDAKTLRQPEPVRRPGVAGKKRRPALTDEGRAYLKYLRENRGALPPGYTFVKAS